MTAPVFSTFKGFLIRSKEKAVDEGWKWMAGPSTLRQAQGGLSGQACIKNATAAGDFYQQSHHCSNGIYARNGAGTIILIGM